MTPSETIAAVRRAVTVITEHGDVGALDVASALQAWLSAADCEATLDGALGLPWGWRQSERRRGRDVMLLDIVRRRWPHSSNHKAAKELTKAARRYEASGWIRDRRSGRRPDGLDGDIFDLLTLGDIPAQGTICNLFSGVRFTQKTVSP